MTDEERDQVLLRVDKRLSEVAQRQTELEEVLTGEGCGLETHGNLRVGKLSTLINQRYVDALVRAAGNVARRNDTERGST